MGWRSYKKGENMQRKKKRMCPIIGVLFFTILFNLMAGMTAFAASNDAEENRKAKIEQYLDDSEVSESNPKAQLNSEGEFDKKSKEQIDAVLERLRNGYTRIDTNGTTISSVSGLLDTPAEGELSNITQGEKYIDTVYGGLGQEGMSNTLRNIWKQEFRDEAEAMGISDENGYVESNQLKDASAKINMLTWSHPYEEGKVSQNDGQLYNLFKKFTSTNHGGVGTLNNVLMTFMTGVACAIAIAFGVSNMLRLTTDRTVTGEAIAREFTKLIFGLWVIYNYEYICIIIATFGSGLLERVMNSTISGDNQPYAVQMALAKTFNRLVNSVNFSSYKTDIMMGVGESIQGLIKGTGESITLVAGIFGNSIVQFASSLFVYTLLIELLIRYIVTPIAIADMFSERFRSTGWMWLKKFMACCMQGMLLFLIIYATDQVKEVVDTIDPITNTAINFTMVGMFARSRQIANDIIGAN